jgi:ribosome-associated protein
MAKSKPVVKKSAAKPAAKPAKKAPAKISAKAAKPEVRKAAPKPAVKGVIKGGKQVPAKKAAAKAPAKKAAPKKAAPKKVAAKAAPKKIVKPKVPADPGRDLAILMARMASDLHCNDVMVLDVTGHSPITRFMVIGTGVSNRQLKAVGQSLEELALEKGYPRFGEVDEDANTTWVVLDFAEIMLHLFEPNARSHYDLETLFPDGRQVRWER